MAFYFYTFWGIILILLCCVIAIKNRVPIARNNVKQYIYVTPVILIAICWMSFTPMDDPAATDKEAYFRMFEANRQSFRDIGLVLMIKLVRIFTAESFYFFFISAFLYVYFYYKFLQKSFLSNSVIVLIASFVCINYFLYGVNTIRSGIALSLCLFAMAKNRTTFQIIIALLFALLIHKSVLIIMGIYMLAYRIKSTKIYLYFWTLLLTMQVCGIFELGVIKNILMHFDESNNYTRYLGASTMGYRVGMRWDFIIYSIIPIVIGWFYLVKLHVRDDYYIRILNTYIGVNAIWMMFVRMPFTDRIAYLSWVMIPFVLLYPLLSKDYVKTKFSALFTIGMLLLGGSINLIVNLIHS